MVQLSPDTITGGDNGSGYRYYHRTIQGFSLTHMSGVGAYGDLGNFLVMPTTGPLQTWYGEADKPGTGYLSAFSKESEIAQAGYYAVTLDDYKVRAEMTATPHNGILRFTFPENPRSRIQIDLARRVGGTSLRQTVKVTDDHTIEGLIECTPDGGGWLHGAGNVSYTLYYHAEFSQPFAKVGIWSAKLPPGPYRLTLERPEFIAACRDAEVLTDCREKEGQHLGFYSEFPTRADQVVQVKVGISFVSITGARANLAAEIPDWNFDHVRLQAREHWANAIRRMEVTGGTEDQQVAFFTARYRALLDPRIFADVNGDYPGGDRKSYRAKNFTKRTIFSGWDVYRSEFPLLTLIAPETVHDTICSLIELADQNGTGYYDRWEFLNAYTGVMNGNPFVVVLNDAYKKGIRDYDVEKAYRFALATCEKFGGHDPAKVSDSLENAKANWNLSELARQLGKSEDARRFAEKSRAYRLLFDPNQAWTYDPEGKDARPEWKGALRPRNADGEWEPWLGLNSLKGCKEGSIYQYGWCVPQDVPGLIELHGGKDLFVAKLADFFERTPPVSTWSGPGRTGSNEVGSVYYNHPNEPCHLIPFLFNRAGAPWLTQKWVRTIDGAYTGGPEGLCGDEDVGQMSAWFILAASGLHPACPGDTRYEIFTPLFEKISFHLDPKYTAGGTFTVSAKNQSAENIYIQSASLNGQPINRCWIDHREIVAGGSLELNLGPAPNKNWGVE